MKFVDGMLIGAWMVVCLDVNWCVDECNFDIWMDGCIASMDGVFY